MPRTRVFAVALLLVLVSACGSDDTSDQSSDSSTQQTTTPSSDTTTGADDACGDASSGAAGPDEVMFSLLCERREAVDDLETELGIPAPTPENASAIREQFCSDSFTRPTRDQIEVQHGLYIRGTAQQDEATGRRWLEAGILDVFERTDDGDGAFVVNVEFNVDAIATLADADEQALDALEERREDLCS